MAWMEVSPEVSRRASALAALCERALGHVVARRREVLELLERFVAQADEATDRAVRRQHLEEVAHLCERELADPNRALTALLAAYQEAPDRELWWSLERLAALTVRAPELAQVLETTMPLLPPADRADGWVRLASVLEALARPDEALAALAQALAAAPDHAEASARRLAFLREHGRERELCAALLERAPHEGARAAARLHLERATLLERLGDGEAAAAAARATLAADPSVIEAQALLERGARGRGDDLALAELVTARLVNADAEARPGLLRELAALALRLGDPSAAMAHLVELRALVPGDLGVLRELERLYQGAGRTVELVEVLAAQVGLVTDLAARAALGARMATLWSEPLAATPGAAQRAAECLEWLLSWRGGDDDTFRALARIYLGAGRARAAIDVMLRHVQASGSAPGRGALHAEIAAIYENEIGDRLRAIEFWELAEAELADPRPAHKALGRLYAKIDPFDAAHAAATLERVLAAGAADLGVCLALGRVLRRERRFERAQAVLTEARRRADGGKERARVLAEEGRVHEDADDAAAASGAYAEALALDDDLVEVRERLAELLWTAERFGEFVPLGERVAAAAENPRVRRSWLRRVVRAANHQGLTVPKLQGEVRALEREPDLGADERAEALCQLALAACAKGEIAAARPRLTQAVQLVPGHRRARLTQVAIDGHAPATIALLGGVALAPTDHGVLHRILDRCEAERAWPEAAAVLARLIEIESVPAHRARYHYAAGAICREELGRSDEALAHFLAALDDEPGHAPSLQAAEALVRDKGDAGELLGFCMRELGRLGPECQDGRRGERLRLWRTVAELCLDRLNDRQGGITALEVAVELDPDDAERRALLAALVAETGPDGRERAIGEHRELLRRERGQVGSYRAIAGLLTELGDADGAASHERAADLVAGASVAALVSPPAARALTAETWARLRHPDVERLLDVLFAAATPALAAVLPPPGRAVPLRRGTVPPTDERPVARALARVCKTFGLALPKAMARPELAAPASFQLVRRGRHLIPELLLGPALLGQDDEARAAADLAMVLVDLRPERFARLVADAAALARVVDAAIALGTGQSSSAGVAATLALLGATLTPILRDQVSTCGLRLHERGVRGETAAPAWLAATERAAARAALVVADVVPIWRSLEARGASRERLEDLAWSSVDEGVREARRFVAGEDHAPRCAAG
jgi:tetratricopeptide (TPR) repeat protein